jgi:hypothetical protein
MNGIHSEEHTVSERTDTVVWLVLLALLAATGSMFWPASVYSAPSPLPR